MSRDGGPGARVLAGVSARSMRVAGALVTALAGGVIALSVATGYGLTLGDGAVSGTATARTDGSLTVDALVAFTTAHPAYPAAVVLGLALFAFGDDVPLLGD